MADEPKTLDPVVVTDSTPDAAPSPVAKQPPAMPNFQQMLMDQLNRPTAGGGGNPQKALQDTIAGKQAEANLAIENAKRKEATMRPLQEAKEARIGQTEQQQAGISKQLNTPFQVPQETVADFSALGGLVGIMGVMLGTSGKMSAQNVLSSATGILDGYKKGRADLIAQKQKEFEANMKRLTALSSQVQAELKTYMDKAAVRDQTAGLSLATAESIGAGGIVAEVVKGQSAFKIQEMNQSAANLTQAAQTAKTNILIQLAKDQESRKQQEQTRLRQRELLRLEDGSLVLYDKSSNTYEAAPDELAKAAKVGAGGKSGAGGAVAGQVGRITGAMSQVSGAVQALSDLPVTTANPVFGQKNFSSLFTAPLSVLNQKMTDQTAFLMQTALAGVARGLATIETSGAATGLVGLTDKIEQAIIIQKGSAINVALYKLAEMRRIVEDGVRTALASDNYTPGEKDLLRFNLKRVEEAIPFTQKQVTDAVRAGESNKLTPEQKKMSFTEFAEIKFPNSSGQPSTSSATKTMPTDERLNAYVAAHPEFGGDINKAKEFLRTQGYK